jgi:uncharacterized membrane protein YdjX (TVP38/TMEM64 family)
VDKKVVKNIAGIFAGALFVLGAWWIIKCQCINLSAVTPAAVRDYIRGFGSWAAVVYVLAYALNTVSIVPPIAVLSLSAGLAFGKSWGAVFLMTGALLGTSLTFFISRLFARAFIERFLRGKLKGLDELLEKKGFVTILFFRLIPLVPYEVLNYAGGFSKIKFRDYFFATFLGIIPGVVISAFFGGALGEVRGLKDLISVKFTVALAALCAAILVPVIYKRLKSKGDVHGN